MRTPRSLRDLQKEFLQESQIPEMKESRKEFPLKKSQNRSWKNLKENHRQEFHKEFLLDLSQSKLLLEDIPEKYLLKKSQKQFLLGQYLNKLQEYQKKFLSNNNISLSIASEDAARNAFKRFLCPFYEWSDVTQLESYIRMR